MTPAIEHITHVYLIGIGGIGMSALARWFHVNGRQVGGYDKTVTPLTRELQAEGIDVHYTDDLQLLPASMLQVPKEQVLVIYTPAVPADHQEFCYFRAQGYALHKRAEVLGMLTRGYYSIGVAGTHGKTTTSTMIAHMLRAAGRNCTAFLGGISANYGTNLLLADPDKEAPVVVIEADEFDRSFLHLSPAIEVITSAEADHLDIYGTEQAVKESFDQYIGKLQPQGRLFVQADVRLDAIATVDALTYGIGKGQVQAQHVRVEQGQFVFDVLVDAPEGQVRIEGIRMWVPGFHNVENALAAILCCLRVGLTPEQVRAGLESYRGVKRRFEYIHQGTEVIQLDDYAHHPTEVAAFVRGVKALYPDKRFAIIFQPHLYTRTRDFAEGFAESLSLADEVLLLDIYPARELPIPGVTAQMVLDRITAPKRLVQLQELPEVVAGLQADIVATVGAGNIDTMIAPIRERLQSLGR